MLYMVSGNFQAATLFHAAACHIVLSLGAHTLVTGVTPNVSSAETDHSWRMKRHMRNYFWLCYAVDKDISIRTGYPPVIDDDYCDLTLPHDYQHLRVGTTTMDEDEDFTPVLYGDLRLSMIKSKSSKLLYSAVSLRKSDAELFRDIRELDDELEQWRLSVDPNIRPSFSFHRAKSALGTKDRGLQNMLSITTNFEYHYLLATIHQATGRCRAWTSGEGGAMEGVRSSLELSVEASRSTLILLREAVHILLGASFW